MLHSIRLSRFFTGRRSVFSCIAGEKAVFQRFQILKKQC